MPTTPELIDLHFNGLKDSASGIDCNFWKSPSDEEILKLRKYLYEHGIKAFLPTLITDSAIAIEKKLELIANHKKNFTGTNEEESLAQSLAYPIGVHIEGGYISRRGTHPEKYCEALGPSVVEDLTKKFPGLIKLWTICPLVDKDGKHVAAQRLHGIIPSYGHSKANYQEAMNGFNNYGVRLVTHWGNGMNIFTTAYDRDEPSPEDLASLDSNDNSLGALGKAAYDHPDVYLMAICGSDADKDRHISPKLIKKLAGTGRLILVTDAVAEPAGPASQTGAKRGYALSGGQVSLDKHVANAKHDAGLTDEEIYQATVINPAKILSGKDFNSLLKQIVH